MSDEDKIEFINQKFGKLIHKAASKIYNGYTVEDYVQELLVVCYKAISSYEAQGSNGTFDDFKDTPGFSKYVKTSIWNHQKKSASNIGNKRVTLVIYRESDSFGSKDEVAKDVEDEFSNTIKNKPSLNSDFTSYIDQSDFNSNVNLESLNELQQLFVRTCLNYPYLVYNSEGKLNVKMVAQLMGISYFHADKVRISLNNKEEELSQALLH